MNKMFNKESRDVHFFDSVPGRVGVQFAGAGIEADMKLISSFRRPGMCVGFDQSLPVNSVSDY